MAESSECSMKGSLRFKACVARLWCVSVDDSGLVEARVKPALLYFSVRNTVHKICLTKKS